MRDLKRVYGAESEEIAMRNLESMMDSWKKYAVVLDNWLDKWEHLARKYVLDYYGWTEKENEKEECTVETGTMSRKSTS